MKSSRLVSLLLAALVSTTAAASSKLPTESELREGETRESLTGSFIRYRQFVDGREVVGGDLVVERDGAGRLRTTAGTRLNDIEQSTAPRSGIEAPRGIEVSRRRVFILEQGLAVSATEIVAAVTPSERYAFYFDDESGALVREIPLFFRADVPARLFPVNPVTAINDPALRDGNDSPAAVPASAYSTVVLRDLLPGTLSGPNVSVVDFEVPTAGIRSGAAFPPADRSAATFEEANAYALIDGSQRYLQSLGYVGSRRIVPYAIEVDAHALNGLDNSIFTLTSRGRGRLLFGDGGTDDAEDADLVLHEYAHAIQESIAPGGFSGGYGSEARALSEGYADYWAFASSYEANLLSGRDPFCIADWDVRCDGTNGCRYEPSTDCLRRVDTNRTMSDFVPRDQAGIEHLNGTIWSSVLRRIFLALAESYGVAEGRRRADTLIIESLFGLPPQPTFRIAGERLLHADSLLYGGAHSAAICSALQSAGITSSGTCGMRLRGDQINFPSADRDLPIRDGDPNGMMLSQTIDDARIIRRVYVSVSITHPFRGDLRLVLISPDGTPVVLKQVNRSDRGRDLLVTFGRDAEPAESLEVFAGRPAAGEWRLQVIDSIAEDVGRLNSWMLAFTFEGDQPQTTRARTTPFRTVPVAVQAAGAADSYFVTDLTLTNPTLEPKRVPLVFTPRGVNGEERFSSFDILLGPWQSVRLDSVVESSFFDAGAGTIEIGSGEVGAIAEIRNVAPAQVTRVGVPAVSGPLATVGSAPLHILPLAGSPLRRVNVGISELSGEAVVAKVRFLSASGDVVDESRIDVPPWTMQQIAARSSDVAAAEVSVVSGGGAVVAWGSTVESLDGEAGFAAAVAALPRSIVLPLIDAEGAIGSRWKSVVWLRNTTSSAAVVDLSVGGTSRRVALPAGATARLTDLAQSGRELLRADVPTGIILSSEIEAATASGSYRQDFAPLDSQNAIAPGDRGVIAMAESSPQRRTNVGLIETSGSRAMVGIIWRNPRGEVVWIREESLPPGGHVQIPAGLPDSGHGSLEIVPLSGGRIQAYASLIDPTGEAITLFMNKIE
jgi:subtilisin-like proprotein convertase family protein